MPKSSTKLQRKAPASPRPNLSRPSGSISRLKAVESRQSNASSAHTASKKKPHAEDVAPGNKKSAAKINAGKKKLRRRRRRNFSLPIDEALRYKGMDEFELAMRMGDFFDIVVEKKDAKLMLEGLKEWARQLESRRAAGSSPGDGPSIVQLVHAVPRPDRTTPAEPATPA